MTEKELISIRHIYIEAAKRVRRSKGDWIELYKFLDLASNIQKTLENKDYGKD